MGTYRSDELYYRSLQYPSYIFDLPTYDNLSLLMIINGYIDISIVIVIAIISIINTNPKPLHALTLILESKD